MWWQNTFWDSDFFATIVTLVVGFVAVILYYHQRRNKKREIAQLILQEIRFAEQMIKEYKRHNSYKLSDRLLPTNNWNSNIHMFVSDFSETGIDSISKFYSQICYIDTIIQKISDQKNDPEVAKKIGDEIERLRAGGGSPNLNINTVSPISAGILRDTSLGIDYLYNTPSAEKLRKLAKRKWYQL